MMKRAFLLIGLAAAGAMLLASRGVRAAEDEESAEGGETFGMNADQNVAAFQAMIRVAEAQGDYQALVGGGRFFDFSDHPSLTGEWPGIRRSDDNRLTTAAGGYQITRTTWNDLGGKGRFGDFSPAAQDAAALALLQRRGALNLIRNGKFNEALARLGDEWEAFKRMMAGNYPITLAEAQNIYMQNGGAVA